MIKQKGCRVWAPLAAAMATLAAVLSGNPVSAAPEVDYPGIVRALSEAYDTYLGFTPRIPLAEWAFNDNSPIEQHARVATDGATWVMVWNVSDIVSFSRIMVARSNDGVTWSSPAVIAEGGGTSDGQFCEIPGIATDKQGRWMVVWGQRSCQSYDGMWVERRLLTKSVSTDDGATWSPPETFFIHRNRGLSPSDARPARIDLASLGEGHWVLGEKYVDEATLLSSHDDGLTWEDHILEPLPGYGMDGLPALTSDGEGHLLYLIPYYSTPGDVPLHFRWRTYRSDDYGRTWELVTTPFWDKATMVQAAFGEGGTVLAILTGIGASESYRFVRKSTDYGYTWSTVGSYVDNECQQLLHLGASSWLAIGVSREVQQPDAPFWTKALLSGDDGVTWSDPIHLFSTPADEPQHMRAVVDSATDGAGRIVACAYTLGKPEGVPRYLSLKTATLVSTDSGHTWTPPTLVSDAQVLEHGIDTDPCAVVAGSDDWLVAWSSDYRTDMETGLDAEIVLVRSYDRGRSWTPARLLSPDMAAEDLADYAPTLATDGNGTWVALWERAPADALQATGSDEPFDIVCSASTDNAHTWSAPAVVASGRAPVVVRSGPGGWAVAWHRGSEVGAAYTADPAQGWTVAPLTAAAVPFDSDATGASNAVRLASNGQGGLMLVWPALAGGDTDLMCSHSSDGGATWSPASPVNSDAAGDSLPDGHPQVVGTGGAAWAVLWERLSPGVPANPVVGHKEIPEGDIFLAHTDDNGLHWTAPQAVNPNADTDGTPDPYLDPEMFTHRYPVLARSSQGRWLAAWQTQRYYFHVRDYEVVPYYEMTPYYVGSVSQDGIHWNPPLPLDSLASAEAWFSVPETPIVRSRMSLAVGDGRGWLFAWHASTYYYPDINWPDPPYNPGIYTGGDADVFCSVARYNLSMPDVDTSARVDAYDLQVVINAVLGRPVVGLPDVNRDSRLNALDIQEVIGIILGR